MYHSLKIEEIFKLLDSGINGLSSVEASIRLKKYGQNKIPEKESASIFSLILDQFKNPLIYILFFALIISFITKHSIDAWIILTIILISGLIGFFQEYKANRSLSKLKKMIKYSVRVLRDGKQIIVGQEKLVKGDVILLFPGDMIVADCRIIEENDFEVVEATLTGESDPSKKHNNIISKEVALADRENMIYMGTSVASGIAKAIVVETGKNTELGKMATLIKETKEDQTPLQKQIIVLGKTIGFLLIIANIIIFGVGILTGKDVFEMFLTSVAVVVAAVPEGLLPAMSVILATGMQKLLKHNGLVRKMISTETLGSVSVICSDKTGTLTEGQMKIIKIVSNLDNLEDKDKNILNMKIGILCNDAIVENPNDDFTNWNIIGNPIDKSFIIESVVYGLEREYLMKQEPRILEIPFNSDSGFMATLHNKDKNYVAYIKGAPEKILEMVFYININNKNVLIDSVKKEKLKKQFESLTALGLRVLALGYNLNIKKTEFEKINKEKCKNFVFSGFVAFKDPLRVDAKESIEICKKAGIKPIIITGDHRLTAISIAKDLGFKISSKNVLEGRELDELSDLELQSLVGEIVIFARVEPRHKLRIITALKNNSEVVAMIGDGVNDAPAIKKADVGVAVGSGTSITKEIADLVLLDNNFKTIVETVKRGRIIFNNIRKVVLYLLTDSFSEMIIISGSVLLSLPLPILPAQILWIKLIEDSFPAMSLSFDEIDENVMNEKPRKRTEKIVNNKFKILIFFYAIIIDSFLFMIFYYFWKTSGNLDYARTITFVGLGITSLFYIYAVRGIKFSIFKIGLFSNKYLIGTTFLGFILMLVAIYVPFFNNILKTIPLGIKEWIILLFYAVFSIFVYEIGKKFIINGKHENI
ncbi:MAG TPA: HAD-IC family P-type ATPase [bacterium]|nr:HAD-IC family P-type ATPase [bacterium]